MLDSEQKKTRWEGIAETIKETNNKNDNKYAEFVASNNMGSLKSMVEISPKAKVGRCEKIQ